MSGPPDPEPPTDPLRPRHAGPPLGRVGADRTPWPPPPPDDRPAQPAGPPDGPDGAGGPVPTWAYSVGAVVLLAMVIVLGFVRPGFFVTKVFDPVAVQNGVRSVLVNSYRVNVSEVICPANQRVLAGRDFTCMVKVDGSTAQVQIVIRDAEGHYQVSRPN